MASSTGSPTPPKVEYELAEYGWSLQPILDSLCAWGKVHIIREYGDTVDVLEDTYLNTTS